MTWARLSDDYSDDCWQLSDAAFRLHTEALIWNARKLLDCNIPKADLPRLSKHPEAAPELVEAGYWSDFGDHYVILHHSDYQKTREEALAIQSRNRANGAKGGRPPKSRERWQKPIEDRSPSPSKTHMGTQTKTHMGSHMETRAVSTPQRADSLVGGKNPGNTRDKNPNGNPYGNPKGLVHIRESSIPQSEHSDDPDTWPTDDFGLYWRNECEEKQVATVSALMEALGDMSEPQAKKCLTAAFPGRRF